MKLYAPNTYWELDDDYKSMICNGCGAKGGIKVPDTFLGLNISEACNIHDYMYYLGKTKGDFLFSNAMFMMNMTAIILGNSNWLTKLLRMGYATKYFTAVALYGDKAYWKGKIKNGKYTISYEGTFEKD